ncbi:sensor histidine kinase [Sphingobium rhizovicinum]|uniref:Sensor histidine kinase n=1 Tax=Sphingobium rhizovicinum TaxID=432308 RepID=A0ABV7NI32_9SPHN
MTLFRLSADRSAFAAASLRADWRLIALLAAYPFLFKLAHFMASPWGGSHFFSLWYPAAGVRLALMWHVGARWTPLVVAEECLIQLLSGVIDTASPELLNHIWGVARAPLAYGVMIGAVRWVERRSRSELALPPMPFGLAAILSPTLAAFLAGLWEWLWPSLTPDLSTQPFATTIAAFLVGDLLGVLLVAPALLWLIGDGGEREGLALPSGARAGEGAIVLAVGWLLAAALAQVEPDISMTPVLLCATWVGLRCGRSGAWAAIILSAGIILPWSASLASTPTRFALHMGLAAVAMSAYLAASFAETQVRARQDIARRDRILFQAERLKTLRAMSVAIIHEISQPLSTLAIETRHMAALSRDDAPDLQDMRQSAELIERKATLLADMVRRLRRFGGRAVDEPSAIPLDRLVQDCLGIAAAEARRHNCRLRFDHAGPSPLVQGHEIELTQVLLNLIRNAMTAAQGADIVIDVHGAGQDAVVHIDNPLPDRVPDHGGMGVGLLVARAIVEAHGGRLDRIVADGRIRHSVRLPVAEAAHG